MPSIRRGRERFGWDTLRRIYLDAKVLNLSPEIVHFEFGTLAVGKTYLKELLGCRLSVGFRGFDLNFAGLDDPRYYEEVFREADLIHCLGEDLWRRAVQRGCPPDKEHVLIPPAIDVALFDPDERPPAHVAGTADRPLRILSVGRLEWKKGYEEIDLDAHGNDRENEIRLSQVELRRRVPRCACTISRARLSPRPVPAIALLRDLSTL